MPYTKEKRGDGTVFHIVPEPLPWPKAAIVVIGVVCLVIGSVGSSGFAIGLFAVFVGAVVLMRRFLPAFQRHRQPTSFSVSPAGLTVDGRTLRSDDIHRTVIRNHVIEGYEHSSVVLVSSPLATAPSAVNRKFKSQVAATSYRVEVEAGGTPTVIAGGLTEPAAFAVMSDVSRILGMEPAA